jgi:DNA-binding CsgD family transcriptional regulator
MNDESPDELQMMQAIRDWAARWHEWNAIIEDVQKQTADLADDDVISLFIVFSDTLLMSLKACRTRILDRYGIAIGQSGLEITESAHGMSFTEVGIHTFVGDICEYAFWAALQHEMVGVMREAEARGATQPEMWRAAVDAVWEAWLDIQIRILGGAMLAAPHEFQRLGAAQGFSGWAHGQIKLYPRIRKALSGHEMDPTTAKLLNLPAAVLMAWDKATPGERLRREGSVISRIVKELAWPGVEQAVQTDDLDWVSDSRDALERVHDRAHIDSLAKRAKLSPRELQVLELFLEDASEAEMSRHLGVAPGTVKSLKYRLVQKLRAVGSSGSDLQ